MEWLRFASLEMEAVGLAKPEVVPRVKPMAELVAMPEVEFEIRLLSKSESSARGPGIETELHLKLGRLAEVLVSR